VHRLALLGVAAVLAACGSAAADERPAAARPVALLGRPPVLVAGRAWDAQLRVAGRGIPLLLVERGARRLGFRTLRLRPGRFHAVVRVPLAGRWALAARLRGRRFPLGTLVVNVSGATLLGLLAGLAVRGDALLLAGTAVLGSYTTFSTWMFETHRLAEDGQWAAGAANVVVSVAFGVAAAALGRWIGGG
jgi:CrcB protein